MKTNKIAAVVLFLILIGAFLVRLYKLDSPIADWHSWRQADTAAVARNFYQEGFNPLLPRGDDMSAIALRQGQNIERYRFVEFPIYPTLVYLGYLINAGVDERIARLINIFFSLGSLIFVYLMAKKYFNLRVALLAAAIYAFLPFNVYFSRVTLPEPSLVFFSLGMLYYLDQWISKPLRKDLFLGITFLALAFLTKPVAGFYLVPLLYSYYQHELKFWPIPKRYLLLLLGLMPFGLWRIWMMQYPEGIPAAGWLLNGNGIRFKPVFWQWIINDRLGREILSVSGTILLMFGLVVKPLIKEGWFLHLLAFGAALYLIVFATGNVQHDYYQYLIIPALAIFVARGWWLLWQGLPILLPRIVTILIALLLLPMMFYSSWNEVKGLYQINNYSAVVAGQQADKVLPKDAIVVAPYGGDTSFLYQINRAGFPFVILPIDQMISIYGVDVYVSTSYDDQTNSVMKRYTVIEQDPRYVIVDLNKPIK